MRITSTSPENLYITAAAFSETGKKIRSFEKLAKGWHFGEGFTPTSDLIERATELENLALDLGFTRTDAFPGPEGEVRYCVYRDDRYYEFTLELDGSVTTVVETDGVENETVSSFEEAKKVLKEAIIWNISDLFIGDIGTSKRRIFSHWRSETPQEAEEFPWLIESVPSNEMSEVFALDSMIFTPSIHPVSQSGSSMTNYYQREHSSPMNQAILETNVIEICAA